MNHPLKEKPKKMVANQKKNMSNKTTRNNNKRIRSHEKLKLEFQTTRILHVHIFHAYQSCINNETKAIAVHVPIIYSTPMFGVCFSVPTVSTRGIKFLIHFSCRFVAATQFSIKNQPPRLPFRPPSNR